MRPYRPSGRNTEIRRWRRAGPVARIRLYIAPFLRDLRNIVFAELPFPFTFKLAIAAFLSTWFILPILYFFFVCLWSLASVQYFFGLSQGQWYDIRFQVKNLLDSSMTTAEEELFTEAAYRKLNIFAQYCTVVDTVPFIRELYNNFFS